MILNQVKILCLMVGVVLVIASGIDSVEDGNSIGLVVETAGDRARHAWIFTAVAGSIFIGGNKLCNRQSFTFRFATIFRPANIFLRRRVFSLRKVLRCRRT